MRCEEYLTRRSRTTGYKTAAVRRLLASIVWNNRGAMTAPNFLIIGAHKAGTSSLHRYLRQHPDVFMPTLKELRFFSYDPDGSDVEPSPYAWGPRVHPIKTWNEYVDLFAPVTTEKAIGEASPCYLNHPRCPTRIKQALPDVRLIVSLRDPVDRAYSGYLMAVRDLGETRPFADTIGEQRTAWHDNLVYYKPCQRYLACFPRERLKVIRAETLNAEPAKVLQDIFSFLEVDPAFEPGYVHAIQQGRRAAVAQAALGPQQSPRPLATPLHPRVVSQRAQASQAGEPACTTANGRRSEGTVDRAST